MVHMTRAACLTSITAITAITQCKISILGTDQSSLQMILFRVHNGPSIKMNTL